MARKKALITGVTGQDGAYLARLLLEKGYEVHGMKRRASSFNTKRIDDIYVDPHEENVRLFLHYGDMTDSSNIMRLVQQIEPDEIYNLAAQSHVQISFDTAEYTSDTDAFGTLRFLEALRTLGMEGTTRFYQASTSELYGKAQAVPQNETTRFYPRSPYAVAKLYAYWICVNYRETYGMHVSNGILFNHESPLRGETFVTQKIATAVASIVSGIQDKLYLGNLDAQRDWGHAREYVEGMHAIINHHEGDDFVLATGRTETVRRFVELAFSQLDREIAWDGYGLNEIGIDAKTGETLVEVDPKHFRPTETDLLIGDATKAREILGWEASIGLEELVAEMVKTALNKVLKKNNNQQNSY
ncbi:MAG: GDP-mannose 4,6-dehydratase [Alphaproteobacteria bacterium]|nr:GDP-mannose 4,6-dehydratase [Alphaproteobacteria bacterium]